MKTIRLLFGVVLVLIMVSVPETAEAHRGHGRHGVNAPHWVPAHIVRTNARHVYFPEYNVYFDRWNGTYIYQEGRRWITSAQLPLCFRGISFSRTYMIGLHLDTPRPYVHNRRHLANYRHSRYNHYHSSYYKKGGNGGNRARYRHERTYDWEESNTRRKRNVRGF